MRILSNLLVALLFVGTAAAQTAADYLKLRNQQHIVQPTPSQRLDTIVGQSVIELQGVVQGSFKSGALVTLMVKRDDGETAVVECDSSAPEWMSNGEVPVRLLLHVSKEDKFAVPHLKFIAAAPEAEIAKVDDAYWKAEAVKAEAKKVAAKKPAHRPFERASRSGALYGWIGRGRRSHRFVGQSDPITEAYRNFVLTRNSRLGYESADQIARAVINFSRSYSVDARLVMAVLMAESDFRPLSTSRTGAMGLGQLMPGTASWMGVSNPYDLEQNLYGTIRLLRTHMNQFHVDQYPARSVGYYQALGLVLAAYNAGEGAVRKYGGVPPYRETQLYVAKVIAVFRALTGDRES